VFNEDSLFLPVETVDSPSFTLSGPVSAVQLIPHGSRARLGPLVSLKEGQEIQLCGDGYNDRTLKVRLGEQFFFVFRRDLEMAGSHPAAK